MTASDLLEERDLLAERAALRVGDLVGVSASLRFGPHAPLGPLSRAAIGHPRRDFSDEIREEGDVYDCVGEEDDPCAGMREGEVAEADREQRDDAEVDAICVRPVLDEAASSVDVSRWPDSRDLNSEQRDQDQLRHDQQLDVSARRPRVD